MVRNIIRVLLIIELVSLAVGAYIMCHPFERGSHVDGDIVFESLLFCIYAATISIGNIFVLIEFKNRSYDTLIFFLQIIVLSLPFIYSYLYEDPNSIIGVTFLYVVMHASLIGLVSEIFVFILYSIFVVLHVLLFVVCIWRKLMKNSITR